MLNERNQVALLSLKAFNTYKLPGGGIEEGEDGPRALMREVAEETGCTVSIQGELGKVIEYRNLSNLLQESFCYLTRQFGPIGMPSYSARETSQRCELVWIDDIDTAVELIQRDTPSSYAGKFIRQRDLIILGAANEFIDQDLHSHPRSSVTISI
jgi:8-oxo-dGTP diphosphatase